MTRRERDAPILLDRYTLLSPIAAGGMATVHLGRVKGAGGFARAVAIKRLHPQFAADPALVARFRREAQAAARIQHPNVVNVLELGRQRDGLVYLVQELLVGDTLRAHLEERSFLPPDDALAIAVPLMNGLAAAHALGGHRESVRSAPGRFGASAYAASTAPLAASALGLIAT